MRSNILWFWLTTLVVGCLLLLAGCGSSPPTRYYQLSSLPVVDEGKNSSVEEERLTIGIGPMEIPQYVDRPQLVTRSGQNELALLEFDRWAEPLQADVTRVLVENLAQLLSQNQATIVSWDGLVPLDYQVQIEITRFDFEKSGEASLAGRWTIVAKNERETVVLRTSRFSQAGNPQDYASMVSAMSQNLETLSQEIAAALKSLL